MFVLQKLNYLMQQRRQPRKETKKGKCQKNLTVKITKIICRKNRSLLLQHHKFKEKDNSTNARKVENQNRVIERVDALHMIKKYVLQVGPFESSWGVVLSTLIQPEKQIRPKGGHEEKLKQFHKKIIKHGFTAWKMVQKIFCATPIKIQVVHPHMALYDNSYFRSIYIIWMMIFQYFKYGT